MNAGPIPPGVACIADYEPLAERALDAGRWAYLNGGAGDETTLRANRSAWQALPLWPRVLQPLAGVRTGVELLGRRMVHPLLAAPVAYQRLAHADGELATAHAAAAQEAGMVLSTLASTPLETVAEAVRADPLRGPLWFQLYMQPDRGATRELVQRAEAAGFEAIVLTVDAPVQGPRDAQRRAGFRLPEGVKAANVASAGAQDMAALLAQAPGWADLEWLVASTHLPVLVKGVLHPLDAERAVRAGAAGVIVSNHGGRTLDGAVATAVALPRIAERLGPDVPLLVDGGIRRGTDVLKALTLGARGVLIGRPVAWGLAVAGAFGVAHVLRLLRDEFQLALALAGCRSAEEAVGRRELINCE